MVNILLSTCNDYALMEFLVIVKKVIKIIQIIVPILLIIGGSISLGKAVINPDDDKKAKKSFFTSIASAVIVFLLPFLINTSMAIISSYGDVGINENGSNFALDITACWTNSTSHIDTNFSRYASSNKSASSISDEKNSKANNSTNNSNSTADNSSNTKNNTSKNNSTNKSSKKSNSTSKNNATNKSSTSSNEQSHNKYVLVGDSRFVGQEQTGNKNSNSTYIAKVGEGLNYLKNVESTMKKYDNKNTAYVINMGVNDLYNANNYVKYINNLAKTYKGDIYFLSVNPVDEAKEKSYGYSVTNAQIKNFNSTMKNNLKNVKFLDSYSYLKNNGYETTDGIHYTSSTYKKIYNYINRAVK